MCVYAHTHTHTHTYIYICIYVWLVGWLGFMAYQPL